MAFWNRNKQEVSNLPPEYAQYYQTDADTTTGRRIVRLVISILIGLIILVLIFLAGRWAYRRASRSNPAPIAPASQPVSNSVDQAPSTTSSAAQSSTPTTTTPSTTTPTTSTQTSTTALPSTGIDE